MGAFSIRRAFRRPWARIRELLADIRGGGDLTTYMLLTAAGAAMVGLTVPSLFKSSNSAARTFQNQVNILERGANPGGGGGTSGGGSDWTFNVGSGGVKVSGPGGEVNVGSGGVSGSMGNGGGSGNGSGAAALNLVPGQGNLDTKQQDLVK